LREPNGRTVGGFVTYNERMNRRCFLRAAAVGAGALSMPSVFARQDKAGAFEELTREQIDAIDKGLRWLAKNQYSTGGIGSPRPGPLPRLPRLALLPAHYNT